jgi:hypothetical protein
MDHMKPRSTSETVEPYSRRFPRSGVPAAMIAREFRVTAFLRAAIIG